MGQTLVEACGDTDVHIVRYAWRKGRQTNRLFSLRDSYCVCGAAACTGTF